MVLHLLSLTRTYWGHFRPSKVSLAQFWPFPPTWLKHYLCSFFWGKIGFKAHVSNMTMSCISLKISMIAKLWRLRHQNSNSALAAPSRPVDPSSRVTRLGNLWRMWSSSDRSPIRTIYDFLNKPMIYMCKRVTVVSTSCKIQEIQLENAFNTSRPQTLMLLCHD